MTTATNKWSGRIFPHLRLSWSVIISLVGGGASATVAYLAVYLAYLYLDLGMVGWMTTLGVALAVWVVIALALSLLFNMRGFIVGALLSAATILALFQPTEPFENDFILATHKSEIARCKEHSTSASQSGVDHQICLSKERRGKNDAIAIVYDPTAIVRFIDENYQQPRPGPAGPIVKQWFDTRISTGGDRIKFFAHCSVVAKGGNIFVVRLTNP